MERQCLQINSKRQCQCFPCSTQHINMHCKLGFKRPTLPSGLIHSHIKNPCTKIPLKTVLVFLPFPATFNMLQTGLKNSTPSSKSKCPQVTLNDQLHSKGWPTSLSQKRESITLVKDRDTKGVACIHAIRSQGIILVDIKVFSNI